MQDILLQQPKIRLAGRVGVIGGVGPGPTAQLYLKVVQQCVERTAGLYPSILIDSLALTTELEQAFIERQVSPAALAEMSALLDESVERLCNGGARYIVLPCNTLHFLVQPLVEQHGCELLHVINATLHAVAERGITQIGVLASNSTRNLGLYEQIAQPHGIEVCYPSDADQRLVNQAITSLVKMPDHQAAIKALNIVVDRLAPGVAGIVLGCTDLSESLGMLHATVPIIDSLTCLIDACVACLCVDARNPLCDT